MSTQPILVVEHEAQCPPGWLGEWLAEAGAEVDVARPYAGDRLPGDLSGHSGMLVLGGEMGAHDDADFEWLTDVKELVRSAVADMPRAVASRAPAAAESTPVIWPTLPSKPRTSSARVAARCSFSRRFLS